MGKKREEETQLTPAKRRFFTLVTVSFPLIVLVALEGGLRLAGVGGSHPLFVEADTAGVYLRMNPTASERYFHGDFPAPGATYDPFRATRRPETFRVMVQGGSTTLGFPYFYGAAFPRMLEWRLQKTFPNREVEVVNTALTAVNSHTLRDLAPEIAEQEPDAVLVYAGHNEYYGALGVASTLAGGNPTWVSLYLRLRRLRLVQVLSRALGSLRGGTEPEEDGSRGTMMERMVGEQEIPLDSELFRAGLEQFRRNLRALLATYAEADIPVYLATVVSNERDQPPFLSRADSSVSAEEWEEAFSRVRGRLSRGDPEAALEGVEALLTRDRLNARGFYQLARLFDEAGAHPQARSLYVAAKERDLLRFRAPEAINAIIREEAELHGAVVVDAQEAFLEASRDGMVGEALITEHVHPTIDGYFLLADAFYRALVTEVGREPRETPEARDPGVPSARVEARWDVPVTAVDSLYGTYLLTSLTAGWPFQDDPTVEARILQELRSLSPEDPVEALALALFRRQVSWPDAMLELFQHYRSSGQVDRAEHVARVLAQERPLSALPFELRARLAMDAGDFRRARAVLEEGWRVEPTVPLAILLGSLHLRRGRHDEAVAAFRRGVALAPPDAPGPRAILAAAQAVPRLRRQVEESPGDADALYELAEAYALTGLADRARATVERLLEVEPESRRGLRLLQQMGSAGPTS